MKMTKVINPSAHCYHCKTDTVIVTLSDWYDIKDSIYRCVRYNKQICSLCKRGHHITDYIKQNGQMESVFMKAIDNSFMSEISECLRDEFWDKFKNDIILKKNSNSSE